MRRCACHTEMGSGPIVEFVFEPWSSQPYSEQKELCFRYAFDNGVKTLELCWSLRISAMEAHGVGMVSFIIFIHFLIDLIGLTVTD